MPSYRFNPLPKCEFLNSFTVSLSEPQHSSSIRHLSIHTTYQIGFGFIGYVCVVSCLLGFIPYPSLQRTPTYSRTRQPFNNSNFNIPL